MGISGNSKGYEMSQRFNGISMAYNGIHNWHILAVCVSGNGRSAAPKVGYMISLGKIEKKSWVRYDILVAGVQLVQGEYRYTRTPQLQGMHSLAVSGGWIGDSMGSGGKVGI